MSIIDFHTHAFPDSLAERAIAKLQEPGDWTAVLDGRLSSLLASMDAAGVERSVVCPIATRPAQFPGILEWCLQIRGERIVPLGSVHPESQDLPGEIDQVARAGLVGLKLHPMYQDFCVDEPRMDALYSAAAKRGLLVVLHCGCDIAYPNFDCAHPRRVAAVLEKHPTLKLIATHMGGWRMWEDSRRHVVGSGVWLETSFSIHELPAQQAVEMIRRHGADRVLFGTDSPWTDQAGEIERIRHLPLTEEEKTAILGGNAARLLEGRGA